MFVDGLISECLKEELLVECLSVPIVSIEKFGKFNPLVQICVSGFCSFLEQHIFIQYEIWFSSMQFRTYNSNPVTFQIALLVVSILISLIMLSRCLLLALKKLENITLLFKFVCFMILYSNQKQFWFVRLNQQFMDQPSSCQEFES